MPQLRELIYSHHIQWGPQCDEAFDDGSWVLHFDVGNRVRLIALTLKEGKDNYHSPDPLTLTDQWLDADEFYGVLERWRNAFEVEWLAAPKVSEEMTPGPLPLDQG